MLVCYWLALVLALRQYSLTILLLPDRSGAIIIENAHAKASVSTASASARALKLSEIYSIQESCPQV